MNYLNSQPTIQLTDSKVSNPLACHSTKENAEPISQLWNYKARVYLVAITKIQLHSSAIPSTHTPYTQVKQDALTSALENHRRMRLIFLLTVSS